MFVRHSLDTATGSHKLLLGCTLWVFNCTGVPVSLRQSGADGALLFGERSDATYQRLVEDEVRGWGGWGWGVSGWPGLGWWRGAL